MIRKSVVLRGSVEEAFALFTQEISLWWPPERRHTGDAHSTIVLDAGGRFFERAADGREVELGKVLAWEAPTRLELDWYPGTDADHPTRVVVHFAAEGTDHARVVVEHGPGPHSQDLFPLRAPRYDASWDLVLGALARHGSPPSSP